MDLTTALISGGHSIVGYIIADDKVYVLSIKSYVDFKNIFRVYAHTYINGVSGVSLSSLMCDDKFIFKQLLDSNKIENLTGEQLQQKIRHATKLSLDH